MEIKENDNIYTEKIPEKGVLKDLVSDKTGKLFHGYQKRNSCEKDRDSCKKGETLVSGRLDIPNDSKEVENMNMMDADAEQYNILCGILSTVFHDISKMVYTGKQRKGTLQVGDYYCDFKRKSSWENL